MRSVAHGDDDAEPWLPGWLTWDDDDQWDQLAARAYVGIRDGSLDPDTAFDLAAYLKDWAKPKPVFEALAEASVQAADPEALAALAREALAAVEYVPDYRTEPELVERIKHALAVLEHDLRATGLSGHGRPVMPDDPEIAPTVWVQYQGDFGHTSGISPGDVLASSPEQLLRRVADELQDAVSEFLFGVWPVCPRHQLGAHPSLGDGQAVWWCSGSGGHVITAIGRWGK
jgi:hypothetical protein